MYPSEAPWTTYDLGQTNSGPVGSEVAVLCWGHEPSMDTHLDARLFIGKFSVSGPHTGPQDCTLGTACTWQLTGYGLSNSNRIRVIKVTSTCASSPVPAATSEFTNWDGTLSTTVSTSPQTYSEFTITAGPIGTEHRICWGYDPATVPHQDEWNMDVGEFSVYGPIPAAVNCTLGWVCSFQLSGLKLANTNKVRVLHSTSACGQSLVPASGQFKSNGVTFSVQKEPDDEAPYDLYKLGTETAGPHGLFKLCWGANPVNNEDWNVEIGVFSMSGPATGSWQCTLGFSCSIHIADSLNAETANVLKVHAAGSTCGAECNDSPLGGIGEVTFANASNLSVFVLGTPVAGTIASGYLLCWGSDPFHSYDSALQLGELAIHGLNKQDQSCTFAQSCSLVFTGTALLADATVLESLSL